MSPLTLVAVALVAVGQCCTRQRTQIVVVVDSDFAIPSGLSALRVSVPAADDGGKNYQFIDLAGVRGINCEDSVNATATFCIPLSFTIEPRPGRSLSQPVVIQVEGIAPGTGPAQTASAVVERSARVEFREGMTLRVPMFLGEICRGVICASGLTCIQGECMSVDTPIGVMPIDPTRGSEFDGGRDVLAPARSMPDVHQSDIADVSLDISSPNDDVRMDIPSPRMDVISVVSDVADASDAQTDAPSRTCNAMGCPRIDTLMANGDFTCALTVMGQVACWGANDEGQLGRGFVTPRVGDGAGEPLPQYVVGAPNARAIIVGDTHACLVATPNMSEVWCWGSNPQGILGVGNVLNPLTDPTPMMSFTVMGPVFAAAGTHSSYAHIPNALVGWGDNMDRALGTANIGATVTVPSIVSNDRRQDSISARTRGMCGSLAGQVSCVGENTGGRFGGIVPNGTVLRSLTDLPGDFAADNIYLSENYGCLVRQNTVKCWGENRASGVLGAIPVMGAPAFLTNPRVVVFPGGDQRMRSLALGEDFVLSLGAGGEVYCWGSNVEGTCAMGAAAADGTITPAATAPHRVQFPASFTDPAMAIAAGRSHACAVDARGAVFCWGRNSHGQVGQPWSDDPRARRFIGPVPVVLPMP